MVAHADRKLTPAELKYLVVSDPDAPFGTRFRFAYRCCRNRWVSKLTRGGKAVYLGIAPTERQAAELAVRYFRVVYGDDWPERHRRHVTEMRRRVIAG